MEDHLFHGSLGNRSQFLLSRSSAEANYRAMALTVVEVVYLVGLVQELGMAITLPVPLYLDNLSALQIVANPIFCESTKHIDIDCYFICQRKKIQDRLIVIAYLPSSDQLVDVFTKLLEEGHMLAHLTSKLGIKNIFITPSLRGCAKELNKSIDVP